MNSSNELGKEKTESKNIFKNLKSAHFLLKLFDNLLKKKSLDIIKYNKNIKDRINISIKDYKEIKNIQKYIHQLKLKYNLLIINKAILLILKKKMKYIIIYILIIIKKK